MLARSGEGSDLRGLPVMALLSCQVQVGPTVWVPTGWRVVVSKRSAWGSWKTHWKVTGAGVVRVHL